MGRIRMVILIFPSLTLIVILVDFGPMTNKWFDFDNNERRQVKIVSAVQQDSAVDYYEVGWNRYGWGMCRKMNSARCAEMR